MFTTILLGLTVWTFTSVALGLVASRTLTFAVRENRPQRPRGYFS